MVKILRQQIILIQALCLVFILSSCGTKTSYVSVCEGEDIEQELDKPISEEGVNQMTSFTVPYKLLESGVMTIHVKFNDTASFDAIFDTGCTGMVISAQEANSLFKSGSLTRYDKIGIQAADIASGESMVNYLYNIHSVSVSDINGRTHVVNDIPVAVVENPIAPVLIGYRVIEQLANENSYTVDLKRRVIIFN